MKTALISTGLFLSFVLVITANSFAQRGIQWRGSGGWGPNSSYNRLYTPETVETIRGEVVRVDTMNFGNGMSYGVHLAVKTDNETIPVHLGPGWFIQSQDIRIDVKDNLVIKGSRISYEGKPAIIAAEVQKGDEVLKLRDDRGFPAWSGWKRS